MLKEDLTTGTGGYPTSGGWVREVNALQWSSATGKTLGDEKKEEVLQSG